MFRCTSRSASILKQVCVLTFLAMTANLSSADEPQPAPPAQGKFISIFDGQTLTNWKEIDFGGEGSVIVENEQIILELGDPLTGLKWVGKELPTLNYEITFEGQRVDGSDFFCGLTFPVKDSHCSLILGGWGGSVIGLSNVNDFDASENDTTDYYAFEQGKWYKIRLRVDDQWIRAWIDDEQILAVNHQEEDISLRIEMELCKPLGLSSYVTKGAIKNLKFQKLFPEKDVKSPQSNDSTKSTP